jgi:hypothetical protein
VSDGDEILAHGSDPLALDSDADGFDDGAEVAAGADPADPGSVPAEVLYGVAKSGNGPADFYRIDPVTGAAVRLGPLALDAVSGMDADDYGQLFATGFDPVSGVHVLATVDRVTGAATEVGPTGVEMLVGNNAAGLSFRPSDGLLYALLKPGGRLATIDPATGAASEVGPTGTSGSGNGLAFSTAEGLFLATGGSLETVDPLTGAATLVTALTFSPPADNGPRINAMDFLPGTALLLGSLNDGSGGAPGNYLATVDVVTGVVAVLGPTVAGLDALAWVTRVDSDRDGLTDAEEVNLGTDPNDPDTDGGGRSDGDEVLVDGTDPLNPADDL